MYYCTFYPPFPNRVDVRALHIRQAPHQTTFLTTRFGFQMSSLGCQSISLMYSAADWMFPYRFPYSKLKMVKTRTVIFIIPVLSPLPTEALVAFRNAMSQGPWTIACSPTKKGLTSIPLFLELQRSFRYWIHSTWFLSAVPVS